GRGHWPGRHRQWWRRAVHRGFGHGWRARAHPDRAARRRHEGVGTDRVVVRAGARRRARHRARRPQAPLPPARSRGRSAQGRSVGRRHDDDRAGEPAERPGGAEQRRDDARGAAAGAGPAHRRRVAEGARCSTGRAHRGDPARPQWPRPRRCAGSDSRRLVVPPGRRRAGRAHGRARAGGAAERGVSQRSSESPAHLLGDREDEEQSDSEGEQPPPVDAVVGDDEEGADGGGNTDREAPVVADEEVVPELAELRERLHDVVTSGTGTARRTSATRLNDRTTTNTISPRSATSAPGQVMPAPSALQKIPNAVSITPTPNFSVFSGTRVRGAWTITPATRTTTSAATAP